MRYEDLSRADQQLLNSDLGGFDKEAGEKVALAQEMYSHGFDKLASETADYLDSVFEKQASQEAIDLDPESEKVASDLAAFIERGYFDGLCKEGMDRHGDEGFYIREFIQEKIAETGAMMALKQASLKETAIKDLPKAMKGGLRSAVKAVKEAPGKLHTGLKHHTSEAVRHGKEVATGSKGHMTGKYTPGERLVLEKGKKPLAEGERAEKAKAGLVHAGKAGLHSLPYLGAAGGTTFLGHKGYKKYKESK